MFTTIANYKGFPLILGSFKNKKLEMLDLMKNRWSENKDADYPNSKAISGYAVISTLTSVIYTGGYDNEENKAIDFVVEYKNQRFNLLGDLLSSRDNHRSIQIDDKIYLFGGFNKTTYIETWENLGDLNSPKYSGSLLNTADYHTFDNTYAGEVFIVLASNSNMKIMEPNQTE